MITAKYVYPFLLHMPFWAVAAFYFVLYLVLIVAFFIGKFLNRGDRTSGKLRTEDDIKSKDE